MSAFAATPDTVCAAFHSALWISPLPASVPTATVECVTVIGMAYNAKIPEPFQVMPMSPPLGVTGRPVTLVSM